MKTLTLEVSDEFAAHIETICGIFGSDRPLGEMVEKRCSWLWESYVENYGTLMEEAESLDYDSEEELFAVADRIKAFVPADKCAAYTWERNSDGKFDLEFIQSKFDEEIFDIANAEGWDYHKTRSWAYRYLRVTECPKETSDILPAFVAIVKQAQAEAKAELKAVAA